MDGTYYTIPRLAHQLGVSATAFYYWVTRGWIPAPRRIDESKAAVYTEETAQLICAWYLRRASAGLCRGTGAEEKQRRAVAVLSGQVAS